MSDSPQSEQTREERIQRFAEMDDDDQDSALAWFDLILKIDQQRYRAVMDLLYRDELSQATKSYLIGLLTPDIIQVVNRARDEHLQLDGARQEARIEAARLGYDWKRRRDRRKHEDRYRDDLDYYSEILVSERQPTPKITTYVALLREQYGGEG